MPPETAIIDFPTFRPLPLLGNAHAQTILGTLLHRSRFSFPYRERHLVLPDGDHLLLYDSVPKNWQPGQPMVVLLHGLTGSHRSGYNQRLAQLLVPMGYRVVRMDMRGAGRGIRWAKKCYNAGSSADVRAVLAELNQWSPKSSVAVVGFSLGGNMALKLAGECQLHPVRNLAAVAALNSPINLRDCSELLSQPHNHRYTRFFASALAAHVHKHRYYAGLPRIHFPKDLTLWQFDEIYTAPEAGYRDVPDYYQNASSFPVLEAIKIPTLMFTARDDPFICVKPYEHVPPRPGLHVHVEPLGGHLGYLGFNGANFRWVEPQIARWLRKTLPIYG